MLLRYSLVAVALFLMPLTANAAEIPALPDNLTIRLVGDPLAAPPPLQITFWQTAETQIGYALEATADGETIPQSEVSSKVHCVANRPDWSCTALGWWQNPDWGNYLTELNTTQAFQWDDVQFDTEYCFRIRVFTREAPAAENWSRQACKRIPPAPPTPSAPLAASDRYTFPTELLTWRQPDFATVAAFVVEAREKESNRWFPVGPPFIGNRGGENQVRSIELSGPPPFVALKDYRVCATNVSGKTCSLTWRTSDTTSGPPTDGPLPSETVSESAQSDARIAADTAVAQPTTVKAQGRVKLAGAPAVTPTTPMSLCNSARIAKGRNSPAAPGLEQQCLAQGGSVVVAPPVDAAQLEALALRGGPIAAADPLAAALRAQQTVPAGQRGFDIGMAATENQTAMGPGKQNTHDSLAKDEQYGYYEAVTFSLQRNSHRDLAATGAAIDRADPAVAAARDANPNVFYQLGFDIATGLFGDPALGALGNTLMGPGSEKIRSSLNADAQLGFDASVTFHQGRTYR
jgi:hypothetical protein